MRSRRVIQGLAALLLVLGTSAVAYAEALVVVQVRVPRGAAVVDGRVTLTASAGGRTFNCQTQQGTCRIDGVPGGAYTVSFQPAQGPASPNRRAMIPPTGTVSLFVSPAGGQRPHDGPR